MALQDVPFNLSASIFLAGLAVGVIITAAFFLMRGGASAKVRDEKEEDNPHEIIMAIKKRAEGRGKGLGFFGAIGLLLLMLALFVFLFALITLGKYYTQGLPNGEEFIPYFIRTVVLPLQERFPFLQGN